MNRLADYLSLHLLRKIGIRYRLIGSCVLLSLLPLAFSGFISYAGSSAAIAERTRVLSTEVVKQVAKNIQFEMARLESDSEALVLSDRVQDALAHYAGGDEMHMTAARRELMRALLERYGSFDFINQKYILDRDNRIIDAQVFSTLGRGVVQFVERAPKLPGRSHWGTYDNAAGQKSMVLLRPIHNKANHQLVGNLFLGVRPSHFWSIFEDVNLGSGTDMFVLDADAGKVVVKNQQRPAAGPDSRPDAALTNELRRSIQRNERSGFAGYSGRQAGEQRAAYAQIADTSWFVVSTVPLGQLTIEAQSVRDKSILVGLSGLVLSIALALILARSISAPLERLAHGMRETEAGNYAGRMAPEGQDELTVLARQFNQMAGKVGQRHVQSEERMMERTRDLAEANGKLAALNMTDGLTGIANRRRFDVHHDRRRHRRRQRAGAGRSDPLLVRSAAAGARAFAARLRHRQHRGGVDRAGRVVQRREIAAHGGPGHAPRQGAGSQPGGHGAQQGPCLSACGNSHILKARPPCILHHRSTSERH
jgi:HAMP domain-containing protein